MHRFTTLTKDIFSTPKGEQPIEDRTWVREVTLQTWDGQIMDLHGGPMPVEWADEQTATPRTQEAETKLLDAIYEIGQNDFQSRPAPSLSVGDLIILDDADGRRFFRIASIGFTPTKRHELTRAERLAVDFSTADLRAAKGYQYEEAERAMHANGVDEDRIERFRYEAATRG